MHANKGLPLLFPFPPEAFNPTVFGQVDSFGMIYKAFAHFFFSLEQSRYSNSPLRVIECFLGGCARLRPTFRDYFFRLLFLSI